MGFIVYKLGFQLKLAWELGFEAWELGFEARELGFGLKLGWQLGFQGRSQTQNLGRANIFWEKQNFRSWFSLFYEN